MQSKMKLPADPVFSQLLRLARHANDQIVIFDRNCGFEASYCQLLHDVAILGQQIKSVVTHGEASIAILAPTSYVSTVASLAIYATGAVAVPLSSEAPAEEIAYTLDHCSARVILFGPEQEVLARHLEQEIGILAMPIPVMATNPDKVEALVLDENNNPSEETPAFVFFTSGSTSRPKGVLHARRHLSARIRAQQDQLTDELRLIYDDFSWSTCFMFVLTHILQGDRVELHNLDARHDLIWERIRDCEITKIHFAATSWQGMMKVFEEVISQQPSEIIQDYVRGVRHWRSAISLGGILPVRVKKFWQELRGQPLTIMYGSTESGPLTTTGPEVSGNAEAFIGSPLPRVCAKISSEGELLVKSPTMFLRYSNNPESTARSFDQEGYFRTGDLVEQQGNNFISCGRLNTDFWKFWDHKVPRLHSESILLALPYIEEGYILPVPDAECETRTAALVKLRGHSHGHCLCLECEPTKSATPLTLDRLRKDLSKSQLIYEVPTLLRVLDRDEEIPKTVSKKIALKPAVKAFFSKDGHGVFEDERVQVLGDSEVRNLRSLRPSELPPAL